MRRIKDFVLRSWHFYGISAFDRLVKFVLVNFRVFGHYVCCCCFC